MLKTVPFQPKGNSFKNTFCVFKEVPLTEITHLEQQFVSKSGSVYYYTELGMYRLSNHWGRLANSKWRLLPMKPETTSKIKLGFAEWKAFYPDDASEKWYYITADFETLTANYYHKNSPDYQGKEVVRTYNETQKRLKNIRNLLTLTQWAKHFNQDIAILRKVIVTELIHTNKTLETIKREVLSNG
ncbi:hypothetical protein [Flavobacterium saliperosum]|uniref:Uncharacterized protein n=1 Tax=Flavobacterium saliperosum TaxID=329186 RepID=A0A1G4VGF4_9FLAO|nr:hypothetical protein [Flavobacterium saliperosum]SCX06425.1 hypothetical protein SAMN02927925_01000 [Flavobacterium saliperosum]